MLEFIKLQLMEGVGFGNPIALTLGENTITVSAVGFDRTVKFQFSSGDVEFSSLSVNGVNAGCIVTEDTDDSSCDN